MSNNIKVAWSDQLNELNSQQDSEKVLVHYNQNGKDLIDQVLKLDLSNFELIQNLTWGYEIIAGYGRYELVRKQLNLNYPLIFLNLTNNLKLINEQNLFDKLNSFKNLRIQIIRAIGNLTIDDDEARQRLLDTTLVYTIIDSLIINPDDEVIKVSCGCLLNIALNFIPMRQHLIKYDGLIKLGKVINKNLLLNDQETTIYLCIRALNNLFEEADAPKILSKEFDTLINCINCLNYYQNESSSFELQIMDGLIDIIESILNENELYQSQLVKDGYYLNLLKTLTLSSMIKLRLEDENNKKELADMFSGLERIIVLISSNDDNLNLFDDETFLNQMIQWLNSDDIILIGCAGLVLGNLARTENHCVLLIKEYKLHKVIYKVIDNTDDLSIHHSMVGLLKNLCLPDVNKDIIGSLPFVKLISPQLERLTAQPLQFGIVGMLKHLTFKNEKNALSLCDDENMTDNLLPIQRLTKTCKKTDNQGIKSEATRAIINVIKVIYGNNDYYEKYGDLIKRIDTLDSIIQLTKQTKFPILQNESIMALSLLVGSKVDHADEVLKALILDKQVINNENPLEMDGMVTEDQANGTIPFQQAIIDLILAKNKNYAIEQRLNTLTFLIQILNLNNQEYRNELVELIKDLLHKLHLQNLSDQRLIDQINLLQSMI